MTKILNFGPAVKYRLAEIKKVVAIYTLVVILVIALTAGLTYTFIRVDGVNNISFSGLSLAGAITILVVGIVSIRESLRLMNQFGTGRKSVFLSEALSAIIFSFAIAIIDELLVLVTFTITKGSVLVFSNIYKDLSVENGISFIGSLTSILLGGLSLVTVYFAGMLISLIFYRINKFWRIVISICIPTAIAFGITKLFSALISDQEISISFDLFYLITLNLFLIILAIAAILALLTWLLLRRAPVKAAIKPS